MANTKKYYGSNRWVLHPQQE